MSDSTRELIQEAYEAWLLNDAKFSERGNNAAGTRARKALQEIAVLAKLRRSEISATRTERKEAKV
jgi:hypothetical protein